LTRRLARFLSTAAVAVLLMTACGADDSPIASPTSGDSSQEAAAGVTVIAKDISLAPASVRATAGDVHITYRSEGSIVHTLLIEGVDGFKLNVAGRGDIDEGSVTLAPGTYTMYCDVAGHRQAGMHGTIEVL
jgi:plastocyanin